ncbi:isocitrate/isopropylmalate dehydrogenase family protein [Artemisia annua]|uniref:Isocitrate/isopropylmalate dehydrogenase family protein n=1 Tax=Artemisia annua TaxID=35608 RepID=A0A2U1NXT3_ARTAN|nr:isocitrate/isopropylmalate dehydrogenase family protein [Artemisia annua]
MESSQGQSNNFDANLWSSQPSANVPEDGETPTELDVFDFQGPGIALAMLMRLWFSGPYEKLTSTLYF